MYERISEESGGIWSEGHTDEILAIPRNLPFCA
jgi:hypothetical protein